MSKQKEQKTSLTPMRMRSNDIGRDLPKGFRNELVKHSAKIDKDIKSGRAAKRVIEAKKQAAKKENK